jgi:hypothetical protein
VVYVSLLDPEACAVGWTITKPVDIVASTHIKNATGPKRPSRLQLLRRADSESNRELTDFWSVGYLLRSRRAHLTPAES